ncbi:MAG: lytic transglycosylase domain-containing protein [Alphaproteobacteria bacterium]
MPLGSLSHRFFWRFAITASIVLSAASFGPAQIAAAAETNSLIARSIGAIDSGSWDYARKLAAQSGDPASRKLVEYLYLTSSRSSPSFAEIASFLIANPNWPGRKELVVRAEHTFLPTMPLRERIEWFRRYPPYTAKGKFQAAQTFIEAGDTKTGQRILREIWRDGGFETDIERQILRDYGHALDRQDHITRFDGLLWRGQRDAAVRMYRLVGRDMELLGKARLALRFRAPDVEAALSRVPNTLRTDAGLFYERVHWRLNNGIPDKALDLARDGAHSLRAPQSAIGSIWWRHQDTLTRMALEKRDYKTAYHIAATHNYRLPDEVVHYAEAEWLAGWIALRFLKQPATAFPHFTRLFNAVSSPISRSRGAYWAGRAAEAKGDAKAAKFWYGEAARYPISFYGQLAAEWNGGTVVRAALDNTKRPTQQELNTYSRQELARATQILLSVNKDSQARQFFTALVGQSRKPQDYRLAASFASELQRRDFGVLAAKQASRDAVWLFEEGYPTISLPSDVTWRNGPEVALILSLSRQESGFNTGAVSSAGAQGLMQLMPATAEGVARKMKIPYSPQKLTKDPVYNLRLGTSYLDQMLTNYDGSYVMALAAYNAGGSRVTKWSAQNGDPRKATTDVIDWIELIPFSETRNYVQRVMESVGVYRLRLGITGDPFRIDTDLTRGRPARTLQIQPPGKPARKAG